MKHIICGEFDDDEGRNDFVVVEHVGSNKNTLHDAINDVIMTCWDRTGNYRSVKIKMYSIRSTKKIPHTKQFNSFFKEQQELEYRRKKTTERREYERLKKKFEKGKSS